jgi:hypothetical protein
MSDENDGEELAPSSSRPAADEVKKSAETTATELKNLGKSPPRPRRRRRGDDQAQRDRPA